MMVAEKMLSKQQDVKWFTETKTLHGCFDVGFLTSHGRWVSITFGMKKIFFCKQNNDGTIMAQYCDPCDITSFNLNSTMASFTLHFPYRNGTVLKITVQRRYRMDRDRAVTVSGKVICMKETKTTVKGFGFQEGKVGLQNVVQQEISGKLDLVAAVFFFSVSDLGINP